MEEKLKDMTPEQIQRVPAANVNIFEGDYLRVLTTKHREGAVVLEDGFAEIPEHPAESSSEEEEWITIVNAEFKKKAIKSYQK